MDLLTVALAKSLANQYTDEKVAEIQSYHSHICSSSEYSNLTGVPTISSPDETTFYFTPDISGEDIFHIYVYQNNAWSLFGSCNLDPDDFKVNWSEIIDKPSIDSTPTANSTNLVTSGGVAASLTSLSGDLNELQGKVDEFPKVTESDATDVDLDITDPQGNVILRLEDGHVKTKEFDSETVQQTIAGKLNSNMGIANVGKILSVGQGGTVVPTDKPQAGDVASKGTTATSDMDFADVNGNVILRLTGGHVQTKRFNSAYIRQLSGYKWACMGDSLTEVNSRTTKHYHDYIAEETGITIYNMGSSGTGYKRHENDNIAFYQRILNVPSDADVVTIFGSFNDLGGGYDLGTATDTGTTTIGGCINTTIDNLYSVIPGVNLGIISPTPWDNITPSGTSGNNYCKLLSDICERRSIPFLDLFHCSNLRPWDSNFLSVAYSKDEGNGVHPDETGHKIITPRFRQFLFSLI